jgi:hypothetical protein
MLDRRPATMIRNSRSLFQDPHGKQSQSLQDKSYQSRQNVNPYLKNNLMPINMPRSKVSTAAINTTYREKKA